MSIFFNQIIHIYFQIFFYITLGIIISNINNSLILKIKTKLINFLIYLIIPLFIFFNLWQNKLDFQNYFGVFLLSLILLVYGFITTKIIVKKFNLSFSNVFLPVTFMNSAYLAIPVNKLILGEQVLGISIIYNFFLLIYHFTIGIYLISDKKNNSFFNFKHIFNNPLIYPVIFGILFNKTTIPTPDFLKTISMIIQNIITPLMLLLVGLQFSFKGMKLFSISDEIIYGILFRMIGGFMIAAIFGKLFQLPKIIFYV